MKQLIVSIIGTLAFALIALGVSAQSDIVARFSPFLVDVTQAIPVEITLTIPNAEGDDIITTTVPITVNIALQVWVAGPYSATVTTPTTPTVTAIPIEPTINLTDDLGFPYHLVEIDSDLTIKEWTAYRDSNANLNFAGELQNSSINKRFSLADIIVRLYRADGTVLDIEDFIASGHWVDPNTSIRFDGRINTDITQVDHYTIEISGQDWQTVP